MIDAAYRESIGGACAIEDLIFIAPVGVSAPVDVRLVIRPDADGHAGGHAVTVVASPVGKEPRAWSERARCRVVPVDPAPTPRQDLAAITARCNRLTLQEAEVSQVARLIEFGPRWHRVVKSIQVGEHEEISLVELPSQFWPEAAQYRMHPALLDAAVGARSEADRISRGETYLPLGYARIRSYEPLPPQLWVHLRHVTDGSGGVATTDITLLGEDGTVVMEITGYAERRVDQKQMVSSLTAIPETDDEPGSAEVTASPHADALAETGIDSDLGIDVLRRILAWRPEPHLIVCPEGIHRSLSRSAALTVDAVERELEDVHLLGPDGEGARPIDTPYNPPETDLQRSIARFWRGSLGIANVGLDDDFFALGGDSLIAVQLAARMRDGLNLELPIGRLFDYPTVRGLTQYLAQQSQTDDEP
jgi:acyl carrier protein